MSEAEGRAEGRGGAGTGLRGRRGADITWYFISFDLIIVRCLSVDGLGFELSLSLGFTTYQITDRYCHHSSVSC